MEDYNVCKKRESITMAKSKVLVLTEEEFDSVKRQADRLCEHKSRIMNRDERRKESEYKLLKGLTTRLVTSGEQPQLNRNDLRAIEGICNITRKAVDEMIVPGYNERMKNTNDQKMIDSYKQYIEKAQKTGDLMMGILIKIEGCL